MCVLLFSSRRLHTRGALVSGVQTCALPIWFSFPRSDHHFPANVPVHPTGSGAGLRAALRDGDEICSAVPADLRSSASASPNVGAGDDHPTRDFTTTSASISVLVEHRVVRSEEHTSELQSLMRSSYAVFCLKKKKQTQPTNRHQ